MISCSPSQASRLRRKAGTASSVSMISAARGQLVDGLEERHDPQAEPGRRCPAGYSPTCCASTSTSSRSLGSWVIETM